MAQIRLISLTAEPHALPTRTTYERYIQPFCSSFCEEPKNAHMILLLKTQKHQRRHITQNLSHILWSFYHALPLPHHQCSIMSDHLFPNHDPLSLFHPEKYLIFGQNLPRNLKKRPFFLSRKQTDHPELYKRYHSFLRHLPSENLASEGHLLAAIAAKEGSVGKAVQGRPYTTEHQNT